MSVTTSVGGMTRRKRYRPKSPLWPSHWDVSTEWKFGNTLLQSRKHDVQVFGTRGWFTFDRLVHNTTADVWWIDCFEQYPYGGFISLRPEKVTKVRAHVESKQRDRAGSGAKASGGGPEDRQ